MNHSSHLDFDQFDKEWQRLDAEGNYLEAARFIEVYIKQNEDTIRQQNGVSIQTMYFHAGQEYAMVGPDFYEHAVTNFEQAYKLKPDWDVYVDGTIAFLRDDKVRLIRSAAKLQDMVVDDPILDHNARLLQAFVHAMSDGRDYGAVYDAVD